MMLLPKVKLAAGHRAQLRVWQGEVSAASDFAAQVKLAEQRFKSLNRATNQTFVAVRAALAEMCAGAQRCVYCEDSKAVENDHMKPKVFYPGLVLWFENFVYVCGACNRIKSVRLAVLNRAGVLIEHVRERNAPPKPPPPGRQVMLNPRREDATQWLILDLLNTFEFVPSASLNSIEKIRANYLLDVLPLNDDVLIAARREVHDNYRARMVEYIVRRNEGASHDDLRTLMQALQGMQHPTVWFEIKRQAPHLREWKSLFAQAPEALAW